MRYGRLFAVTIDLPYATWGEWAWLAMTGIGQLSWVVLSIIMLRFALAVWRRRTISPFVRYSIAAVAGLVLLVCLSQVPGLVSALIAVQTPPGIRETVRNQQAWTALVFVIYSVISQTLGVVLWLGLKPFIKRTLDKKGN